MKSRILHFLLYSFCFSLPLSQFLNSRLLFVTAIVGCFLSFKAFSFRAFFIQSWDLLLYLFILVIGLAYSFDIDSGLRQVETSLSLLGVPLVVYNLGRFSKERTTNTFYAFVSGVFLAGVICLFHAAVAFLNTGDYQVFFYNQLTQIIDSHPTYFAYYLIFVITYGLYLMYYEFPKRYFAWIIIVLLFFFMLLLLTGGQTAFISLILTFSFFISKYALENKDKRESVTVALVVILLTCMVAVMIAFQNNEQLFLISSQNDYWERMALWKSAINANANLLTGVGTGDYHVVLNNYYRQHEMAQFANENLNSHNQYIQSYFSNGLIGLLGLLFLLARPLYFSVRHQNLLGILLYFPLLMYGVTEVFLGRYQGVVFVAFVHQILVSQNLNLSTMAGTRKVTKL
jgi:O-antigen ligase